jgi:hypothetical protein
MFVYRPPKSSCWGHAIGSKDPLKVQQKIDTFFDAFFERVDYDQPKNYVLTWKNSVLPNTDWPAGYLEPEGQRWQQLFFIVTENRIMFPMGIVIPISPQEPASYEFLRRFSQETPFKMSPKHFQVGIIGKTGKLAWRKPGADIAARLQEVIV